MPAAPDSARRAAEAVAAFARGELVLVQDDEDREDEGDLVCAAETVTPEQVAFVVRWTTGIVCVPMTGADLDRLALPQMVEQNAESLRTAFAVSVDAAAGITTGVSAAERALTIRTLADPDTTAADLVRPGHVFPLRYREGGLRVRRGHTEATVDLALAAGRRPVGVLAELVAEDGSMMRGPQLRAFASRHRLPHVTVGELAEHLPPLAGAAAGSARGADVR
ncbi:3,4-dihydroxy-2-butanone-4-phosphate synthase [Quadrisphaera sp. DSM 44207]|uniref:3,4-dihydroxy-2-butanone-4-phosphate synthase n=1 Tax=Quadrisphaera sp. DSM 44207 TaxID=1881057 RepID=UPI00087E8B95|nr:3,4-dihydroxy-2-butanone-4-phosphate synthase [Quadrisphaera sp. DSM 44207]SDQ19509.1 3,4-dihydroxy 2-butanone 4-phosphate synthase / GTP cyclohydrolase II [Quadrisphaera sp. DSM 44207]